MEEQIRIIYESGVAKGNYGLKRLQFGYTTRQIADHVPHALEISIRTVLHSFLQITAHLLQDLLLLPQHLQTTLNPAFNPHHHNLHFRLKIGLQTGGGLVEGEGVVGRFFAEEGISFILQNGSGVNGTFGLTAVDDLAILQYILRDNPAFFLQSVALPPLPSHFGQLPHFPLQGLHLGGDVSLTACQPGLYLLLKFKVVLLRFVHEGDVIMAVLLLQGHFGDLREIPVDFLHQFGHPPLLLLARRLLHHLPRALPHLLSQEGSKLGRRKQTQ